MEKNKVQVDSFPLYKELYMPFALAALLALALGLVLKLFVIKYLPD